MDFVVVGLGLGALAVLLGLAARDLGPMVRRVPRDGLAWAEVAARVRWGRACRAAGLVLALAGAGIALLTGVALLARVSDDTGMWVVLGGILVAALAIGAWALRYRMAPADESEQGNGAGRAERTRRPTRISGRADSVAGEAVPRRQRGRPADVEPVLRAGADRAGPGSRPARRRVDDAPPMGALTVDAMGGLRRSPVTIPPDEDAPETIEGPATGDGPWRDEPKQANLNRLRSRRVSGGDEYER